MGEDLERLVRAEARLDGHDEYIGDLHAKIDKVLECQMQQRGFIAGIVFTVGAVASLITWFLNSKLHF